MKVDYIPLPEAVTGREYIIDHIKHGGTCTDSYSGYGILPGIKVKILFSGPFNDPTAYEIMGTVIALRYTDSKNILVRSVND